MRNRLKVVIGVILMLVLLGSTRIIASGAWNVKIVNDNIGTPIILYQCPSDTIIQREEICLTYSVFDSWDKGKTLENIFLSSNKDIKRTVEKGYRYTWVTVWKEGDYIWFSYFWR